MFGESQLCSARSKTTAKRRTSFSLTQICCSTRSRQQRQSASAEAASVSTELPAPNQRTDSSRTGRMRMRRRRRLLFSFPFFVPLRSEVGGHNNCCPLTDFQAAVAALRSGRLAPNASDAIWRRLRNKRPTFNPRIRRRFSVSASWLVSELVSLLVSSFVRSFVRSPE